MGLKPASVSACVHTFKHENLSNQLANHNQISSEALLGWGIDCIRFWVRSDQNSVSMATDSSHRVIMGKSCDHSSSFIFDLFFFILAGNKDNHKISNEFEIRQDLTKDL